MSKEALVSALSLRRRYGPHYEEALEGYIEEHSGEGQRRFVAVKPLPTQAEYDRILRKTFTRPVTEWVQAGLSTLCALKQDYEEWLGSMPDSLQGGSKADELQQTIEELEQIEGMDWPGHEWLAWVKALHFPATNCDSRPKWLAEAISTWSDCAEELERLLETGEYKNLKPTDSKHGALAGVEAPDLTAEQLREVASQLREMAEEAELVSLPGMF